MRKPAAQRMLEILNATGAYQMELEEDPGSWDLLACGEGLDSLETSMDALLSDLFPLTMSEGELSRWENLYGFPPVNGALYDRRERLGARLAMNPKKFAPGDFSHMLPAAGVKGELAETAEGLTVLVGRLLGVSEAEARRELEKILPAHLSWEWSEDMNWVKLDAYLPAFSEFDGLQKTWEELDGLTQEELEAL